MRKFFIGILILVGLLVVGANIAVKLYFTKERIEKLVIPPAEKALGRKVGFSDVSVSIFSGVDIKGFFIKEEDEETDFVRVKDFVLKYRLLPLLQKRFVVKKVEIVEPYIRIVREKGGSFNYESMDLLKSTEPKKEKSSPKEKSLPVSLLVESVVVRGAKVSFEDKKGELPEVMATSNAALRLDFQKGNFSLLGKTETIAKMQRDKTVATLKIDTSMKGVDISYKLEGKLGKSDVALFGTVQNYLNKPKVVLNLYSKLLDVKEAVQEARALYTPKKDAEREASSKSSSQQTTTALPIPLWLDVKGAVNLEKVKYSKAAVEGLKLKYSLSKGILRVEDGQFKTLEGGVAFALTSDLNKVPIQYEGFVNATNLLLGAIPYLEGSLSTSFVFNGRGTEAEEVKRNLNAKGKFSVRNLAVKKAPVTVALSRILGVGDLQELKFEEAEGEFTVKQGRVFLDSVFSGKDLQAEVKGTVGLDGSLNLPVRLILSTSFSQKLLKRLPQASLLRTERGTLVIPVKLKGTLSHPQPVLTLEKRTLEKGIKRFFQLLK